MKIHDQMKDKKIQYSINKEASKISVLSSGETNKYKDLPGEEMLSSNQKQIIKQDKYTYSPLAKAFEKKDKIEDWQKEQVKALKSLEASNK